MPPTGLRNSASKAALRRQGRVPPPPPPLEEVIGEAVQGPTQDEYDENEHGNSTGDMSQHEQVAEEGDEEGGAGDEGREDDYYPGEEEPDQPPFSHENEQYPAERVNPEIPWQSGPEPTIGEAALRTHDYDDNLQAEMEALGDAVSPVVKCGVCDLPCRIGVGQESQQPYMMCQGDCKFVFLGRKSTGTTLQAQRAH